MEDFLNIIEQHNIMLSKGWDKIYWAIDLHKTSIKADYNNESPIEFEPNAEKILKRLSDSPAAYLIMYTCSYPDEIKKYLEFFESHGIHFNEVNKNTDVQNNRYGYFNDKPYFNIIVDDKAGFKANEGWYKIENILDYVHRKKFLHAEVNI